LDNTEGSHALVAYVGTEDGKILRLRPNFQHLDVSFITNYIYLIRKFCMCESFRIVKTFPLQIQQIKSSIVKSDMRQYEYNTTN